MECPDPIPFSSTSSLLPPDTNQVPSGVSCLIFRLNHCLAGPWFALPTPTVSHARFCPGISSWLALVPSVGPPRFLLPGAPTSPGCCPNCRAVSGWESSAPGRGSPRQALGRDLAWQRQEGAGSLAPGQWEEAGQGQGRLTTRKQVAACRLGWPSHPPRWALEGLPKL